MYYGVKNSNCSLSDKDIKDIFRLREEGLSTTKIAKMFYVSQPYISMVLNGKRRAITQETCQIE